MGDHLDDVGLAEAGVTYGLQFGIGNLAFMLDQGASEFDRDRRFGVLAGTGPIGFDFRPVQTRFAADGSMGRQQ